MGYKAKDKIILVTGSNGQLGMELQAIADNYDYTFKFTDREELDITNRDLVLNFVTGLKPYAIINAAAYTAVDKAEEDEENADKVNHLAVSYLAEAAKENGSKLVHISTDYVFDGMATEPYKPNDPTSPQGVYGKTKLAGEEEIKKLAPDNSVIIRTSWLYSVYGNNFVKTMIRLGKEGKDLKVVDDQLGSPTNAADLANAIMEILPKLSHSGSRTYHFSNTGTCTWYGFAAKIFELAAIEVNLSPVTSDKFPTKAKRPKYSVMSCVGLTSDYDLKISDWINSLSLNINSLK
ncbi:dTDP-4-dehydrorhamnose reductase [Robertkochia solimangrovi]|uniref:dTDP-4-dehydrorhamnose reductase n=1 Tax=Robertkochia solimangrovi TaxID=2213046 RepID=UPI00117EFE11|nr:dTDP-4-dehydrorhamnose reductase [Robertkochia solimangrovi]TRZ44969.1 dTDP-4-dehydrorhamnose reductase [Robertkochia solimangrovi]